MPKFTFENYKRRFYKHSKPDSALELTRFYLPESYSLQVLGMQDRAGNQLALYQNEYLKLRNYVSTLPEVKNMDTFQALPVDKKTEILEKSGVGLLYYFSQKNLDKLQLDATKSDFSPGSNLQTVGGQLVEKKEHQICVVMKDGNIYLHPKVRNKPGSIAAVLDPDAKTASNPATLAVNHSSLSTNVGLQFAGSFCYEESHGWTLDNRSGHYGTRAYQVRIFLEKLQELGVPLENLSIKTYISKTGEHVLGYLEKDYDTSYENAQSYLDRVRSSLASSAAKLEVISNRSSESPSSTSEGETDSESSEKNSFNDPMTPQ